MNAFDYDTAFCRNWGWLTPAEQKILRTKRIAVAGMGGVGGIYMTTLSRLGLEKFSIADHDEFELKNFNRQIGATMDTIGKSKTEVMEGMIRAINPGADIRSFPGVNDANRDEFLTDVDLYIDGIDFFEIEERRKVFAACWERGIPGITIAPVGMGAAAVAFIPGKGMTYEEYFGFAKAKDDIEKVARFMVGLSPAMIQRTYVADHSAINIPQHRAPSTIMGVTLCAGMAATFALKVLLGRGSVKAAPHGLHFDAYRNKLAKTWRPGGNDHILQRLALAYVVHKFRSSATNK